MTLDCQKISSKALATYCIQVVHANKVKEIEAIDLPVADLSTQLRAHLFQAFSNAQIERGLRLSSSGVFSHSHYSSLLKLEKSDQSQTVPWNIHPRYFDDRLLKVCVNKIRSIDKMLQKRGLTPGTVLFQKEMVSALLDFARSTTPLSLHLTDGPPYLPKNPTDTVRSGKADCYEFKSLFLVLCRIAKLDAIPIEVFRDEQRKWTFHVEVAVRFQDRTTQFINLRDGIVTDRTRENWTELTDLEDIALGYNNWGTAFTFYSTERLAPAYFYRAQIERYKEGLKYADHYLLRFNLAWALIKLRRTGNFVNLTEVEELIQQAQRKKPDFFNETEKAQKLLEAFEDEKRKGLNNTISLNR